MIIRKFLEKYLGMLQLSIILLLCDFINIVIMEVNNEL